MYVPAHFDEPRREILYELIEQAPLGVLFTHGRSGMDANHLPFHLSRDEGVEGVLHCHVARANPVWQDISTGDAVLVVFRAADAYISPNWYPSKREFKKQVPTWNYRVVHAHGRVTIRDDERYVRTVIARLTKTHESRQANTCGDEALVVFRAADAYISPNWYPSKREFKKQVPTWNYQVVHAHGRVAIRDDERYVRTVIARLTKTHESTQANPWKMTDSPKDFIDMMVKNIVGIEIEVTKLVGKMKLSQNKETRDILEAGATLKQRGQDPIGEAMLAFGAEKAKQG